MDCVSYFTKGRIAYNRAFDPKLRKEDKSTGLRGASIATQLHRVYIAPRLSFDEELIDNLYFYRVYRAAIELMKDTCDDKARVTVSRSE